MRPALLLAVVLLVPAWPSAADDAPLPDYPLVEMRTSLGAFVLELDTRRAPVTVRNFLKYVEDGFYEGLIFHRVVPGFIVQAGSVDAEFEPRPPRANIFNESGNGLANRRGTVGMARTSAPHSANAQFYINLADNPALDPSPTRWGYAVFGKVIRGMAVVERIGTRPTGPGGPFERNVPTEPVIIEQARLMSRDALGGDDAGGGRDAGGDDGTGA